MTLGTNLPPVNGHDLRVHKQYKIYNLKLFKQVPIRRRKMKGKKAIRKLAPSILLVTVANLFPIDQS